MDRRQYFKHFIVLFSGTAASQVINLCSYPILGRLYRPIDFGGFAIFVALSAIPSAVACARFDFAIPTVRHAGRFAIYWLCLFISLVVALASMVCAEVYWLVSGVRTGLTLPLLLGASVALTGFCNASSSFLLRADFYRLISLGVVLRTAVAAAVQIGFAFVWRDAMGLIIGFCLGFAAQGAMLAIVLKTRVRWRRPRLRHIVLIFHRYRAQVSVDTPGTFIAALALNALNIFILMLFGTKVVGFYSLANRMAILPLQLFNDSLAQVFFQKAARAQERLGAFWNEMKFNLLTSTLLSLGLLVGIYVFCRPFISIFLGTTWLPSAAILVILAPMLALRSLSASIATSVFVLKRVHWLFIHNCAMLALLTGTFLIARWGHFGLDRYLLLTSTVMSIEAAGFIVLLAVVVRRRAQGAKTSVVLPPTMLETAEALLPRALGSAENVTT